MKKAILITMILLKSVLFIYFILVVFFYFSQRNFIYFPDKTVPIAANWGVRDYVPVEAHTKDGLILNAWYLPFDDKESPVVLMFHGNASHFAGRIYKAPTFLNEGVGLLLAEYRGYGGNSGKISEENLYDDGRAYIKWLQEEQGISPEKIILYGESLGTGIAVQMAMEYPVKALILEAPYTSIPDVAKQYYFFIPVNLLIKDSYRNIDKIKKVKAPLLIIHGQDDNIIPIKLGIELFNKANEPKTFINIPAAGHNNLYDMGAPLHIREFLRTIAKE
ncbi:MAG: alpha/beta hydrolase [Alphaproteobacteria bacterium]|nr:alpha/beta hydrolase [Alphaproteobacteria bacterium]